MGNVKSLTVNPVLEFLSQPLAPGARTRQSGNGCVRRIL